MGVGSGVTITALCAGPGVHVVSPHVKAPPPPPVHPVAPKRTPLHTKSMSPQMHVPPSVLSSMPPAPNWVGTDTAQFPWTHSLPLELCPGPLQL